MSGTSYAEISSPPVAVAECVAEASFLTGDDECLDALELACSTARARLAQNAEERQSLDQANNLLKS